MPRFFVTPEDVCGETVVIRGEDARHIAKVLRMRVGEKLTVCDTAGTDYFCTVTAFTPDEVYLTVDSSAPTISEPTVRVVLYVALSKGDKLDTVVQKAVELGASEIRLFTSKYCVAKWTEKDAEKKTERLCRIAAEAAKQCGRGMIPRVAPPIPFSKMCKEAAKFSLPILCYEGERATSLRSVLEARFSDEIAVVIGSEGGFAPEEAEAAVAEGLTSVTLGPRILRCETAPSCVLSAIFYHAGEL